MHQPVAGSPRQPPPPPISRAASDPEASVIIVRASRTVRPGRDARCQAPIAPHPEPSGDDQRERNPDDHKRESC